MVSYLSTEVGDAVSPATLRAFCEGSPAMLAWLERHGVPFEGSLCPDKTSYPTNRHYLYYSGSELSARAWRRRPARAPGPRPGHLGRAAVRPAGRGGARQRRPVLPQTGSSGWSPMRRAGSPGCEARTLRGAPVLGPDRAPGAAPLVGQALPVRAEGSAARCTGRWPGWSAGTAARCRSAPGAVWCWPPAGSWPTGPCCASTRPAFRGGLPLGTPGDDGSGIRLGAQAGGAAAFLDRVSVWRFLSPPPALLAGVLVDQAGLRVCDESRYGAAIGEAIVAAPGGGPGCWPTATLARPAARCAGARCGSSGCRPGTCSPPGGSARRRWPAVAARAGIDPDGLAATVAAYNAAAARAADRRASRPTVRAQDQPPYSLIDCSVRPRLAYPAPVLTLGGLVVAEDTGQVRRADGAGARAVRGRAQRGGPVLALLRQRALAGGLCVLRPAGGPEARPVPVGQRWWRARPRYE